ncbi:nuclear RNA export factor 1 [Latimeria chalumnae]|uniref:Nuclear RNA export factor 1 n=1 Tax=Latimeria chalumnae TaxID=7897 RepID=H2ZVF3_LATCH|nr:PREDICTED: nuclear RNA export factor 1 [Latimeria chalumnae]|eukprot:XP_005988847.1 PREDICTED: nuclear RNA export factor 1 [Latimeria chalumnae]
MSTGEDGRYHNEHDDRLCSGFIVRKKKGRGPFRWKTHNDVNYKHRSRGGGGPNPRSRLEDDDGDIPMSDSSHDVTRGRYNPYSSRPNRRGDDWHDRDRGGPSNVQVTVRRDPLNQDRGLGSTGPRKNWFKITIPYGKKYDKSWLLTSVQNLCSVPFSPVEFHYDHNKAVFYVEDSTTANALKQVSRKITDRDNYKVSLMVSLSSPPSSVQNELKPEHLEHLKQCMSKRYDGSQQALDLNSIRSDPDLVSQNIDVVLSKKSSLLAVIKIIEENIPELLSLNLGNNRLFKLDDLTDLVTKAPNIKILNLSRNVLKSDRELDKVKGFKLEELWLDGNPLCDSFRDQSAYISAIRERFPKLLRLDGHDLPPPIAFDVEAPTTLPPCKGSYFITDDIKVLVLRFLQQYYSVYDSGDRQALLDAYHDGACCSLSIPYVSPNPSRCSLGEYFKDSRNVKKLKDPTLRFKLLKHTRLNVVAFLNELPKTQHDVNSFVVDVNAQTNTLLCFTVHGIFKEVDGKSRDSVRAFSRVFIAVPAGNAGLCIVNDELFIRNATTEEIRKAFVTPAPTPSSSPVPTLTAPQQEMLQVFSVQSGMNLEWSQKCLQDNDWDFNRSAQIFTQLKAEGKIPEVAFIK